MTHCGSWLLHGRDEREQEQEQEQQQELELELELEHWHWCGSNVSRSPSGHPR